MTAPDLDALDALLNIPAHPLPWEWYRAKPTEGYCDYTLCRAEVDLIVAAVNALPALIARLRAAEAERDAAVQDAERYRWLRDHMWSQAFTNLYAIPIAFTATADKAGEGIDAAIDAARKGKA